MKKGGRSIFIFLAAAKLTETHEGQIVSLEADLAGWTKARSDSGSMASSTALAS
jgi:hypothetical protein